MHVLRAASFLPLFVLTAWAAEASTALPKTSPFVPVGGPTAPVESSAERIEFAGVSTMGSKTDFIFYDKTAKKSHWVAKGETKEGISVVSYDEQREQVVVKLNGAEKTLSLRKATRSSGPRGVPAMPAGFNLAPASSPVASAPMNLNAVNVATAPAAAPTTNSAPAAPQTPEAIQQKQETEARMLVSDLLEIGMAQRKAYEEAQRKASATADGSAPPAAPATPPAPNPTQPDGR